MAELVGFGGPWFAVNCLTQGSSTLSATQLDLYNLSAGQWTQVPLPQMCGPGICDVDGVGTKWIRFVYSSGYPDGHTSSSLYLQNIATGAFEEDPVDRYGGGEDDLDSPLGDGQPCVTLSTRHYGQDFGPPWHLEPGWTRLGKFVLSSSRGRNSYQDFLQECGTSLRLRLPGEAFFSAKAVLYQTDGLGVRMPVEGRALPNLRPLIIPKPKGTLVGLSDTTLYTLTNNGAGRAALWAGTFNRP